MTDRGPGGAAPAAARPLHYVVRTAEPLGENQRPLIGFDLAGDTVRRATLDAARDAGTVIFSEPVPSQPTGTISFFVAKALFRPGAPLDTVEARRAALSGFVTSTYTSRQLDADLTARLPEGTDVELRDAGTVVVARGSVAGGVVRGVQVGDRSWTLLVDGAERPDRGVALALLALTAVLGGGLAYLFQRSARHDREVRRSEQLMRHTAALAQALGGAVTVREVKDVIEAHLPTLLGLRAAALGFVDPDQEAVVMGHLVPTGQPVGHRYEAVPLDGALPVAEAARTGEMVVVRSNQEWRRRAVPLDALRDLEAAGVEGAVANPIEGASGQVVAVLAMGWGRPLDLDDALLATVATITEMAGQALERATLVERSVADARRSEALAELAEVLATARTEEQVARAVADRAAGVVGAASANVVIRDQAAAVLRVHHSSTTRDVLRARFAELRLDDAIPHADVARDGGTLTFADRRAFGLRYPHLEPVMAEGGNEGVAVAPLRDSTGHRLGAVGFVWSHPVVFDESVLLGLQGVAELCSNALERAQLSDAEHRLVTTLQDSVLAPLPQAPDLACAARYLPAARNVGMGGDWYEGLVLPDGRYVVVVGDVAGHGITAVGQMAQFRAVLGALARLDTPLDQLFPLATSVVQGHAPIASAIVAVIDTAAEEVRYVAAGHPPPLLRLPGGDVVVLQDGRQPLLGVPTAPAPAGRHAFPSGSTLVCYTDGLVERRAEPIDESVGRLAHRLRGTATADPEALADELLGYVDGRQAHGDDVAVAVLTSRRFGAAAVG
jgi:GAF domain-containing protein